MLIARYGHVNEIAEVAAFITGTGIVIDGGATALA